MLSGERPCARSGGYAEEPAGACEKIVGRKGSTAYEMRKPPCELRRWPQNYEGAGAETSSEDS